MLLFVMLTSVNQTLDDIFIVCCGCGLDEYRHDSQKCYNQAVLFLPIFICNVTFQLEFPVLFCCVGIEFHCRLMKDVPVKPVVHIMVWEVLIICHLSGLSHELLVNEILK
jgi:hypothetical protein